MPKASRRLGVLFLALTIGGATGCATVPAPTPATLATAAPSAGGSQAAAPALTPGANPTPIVLPTPPAPSLPPMEMRAVTPATLPAPEGTVYLAPGPAGDVYLLVDAPRFSTDGPPSPPSRAVFTRLDSEGRTRPGWPVMLEGWSCAWTNGMYRPFGPLVAPDGSIRAVCTSDGDAGDWGLVRAGVGLDGDGRPMAGWPVDLRTGGWDLQAVLDGETLVTSASVQHSDQSGSKISYEFWVTTVSRDGTVNHGVRLATAGFAWDLLGTDGVTRIMEGDRGGLVTGLSGAGPVEGWPVTLGPRISGPASGPGGTSYFAQVADGRTSTIVLGPDGARLDAGSDAPVAGQQSGEWTGAGPHGGPAVPLVAADGTVYLLEQGKTAVGAFGLDPTGAGLPGFPLDVPGQLETQGTCARGETGCGVWVVRPTIGVDGTLYLPLRAPEAGSAGSLVAIARSGSIVAGWPVALPGDGRAFWSVTTGADGTTYAVVAGDPGHPGAASVLAIGPDGRIRYEVPLVSG